ncbi:MAG: hypothetical protein M1834_006903 [Cirrosporium novae-zelandiae]|nr:MAG: hypothetical protein M1834_006903 [Cirrosporium novae-zelandiae]
MELDYERDDSPSIPSFKICEKAKKFGEEMTMEQEEEDALAIEFDYDGSQLTPEQRRAIFMKWFAYHLKDNGLRSPQYFEDKSQCLSIMETVWPGAVGYFKANRLKRGYIDPEKLTARLRELKPSDNFELRKFRHPPMSWKSLTPLREKGFERFPPDPDWLIMQLTDVNCMRRRLGNRLTDKYQREIRDRWNAVESGAELEPSPDLHLLRDMGHSPGGTLFPWYLVKGLMALHDHAYDEGCELYDEEYDSATVKREEAIIRWRKRNPDSILADDPVSIYGTWPADLMDELDEIDREAIRCGRRKYVALLRETGEKMQALVAFWRDCGLVTGHRTPPSPWWQDPKAKAERLPKPQYLKERLDAINTEFVHWTDKAEKLRMIETSHWIETVINTHSEPAASDTPFPQPLLDELDIVWRDRDWLDHDDTEDEMIARIREWRNSKHRQRLKEELRTSPQLGSDAGPEEPVQKATNRGYSGQRNLLRDNVSGPAMAPEETRQLQEKLSKGTRRRLQTKITMVEDQTIWQGRLRSRTNPTMEEGQTIWQDRLRLRRSGVSASRESLNPAHKPTGKPKGIVKQYRRNASKKQQVVTKGQAATANIQKAGPPHLTSTQPQSHFNERSTQAIPHSATKSRRTKDLRRQSLRQANAVQAQGAQKACSTKERQSCRLTSAALTTKRNQELSRLLTPPRSE